HPCQPGTVVTARLKELRLASVAERRYGGTTVQEARWWRGSATDSRGMDYQVAGGLFQAARQGLGTVVNRLEGQVLYRPASGTRAILESWTLEPGADGYDLARNLHAPGAFSCLVVDAAREKERPLSRNEIPVAFGWEVW
ncbi:MAG TPA: hypothetical protein VHN99_04360, partial [Deinococcales bacterium]|nr:hypothetical protein [Deinococcales bacterium]